MFYDSESLHKYLHELTENLPKPKGELKGKGLSGMFEEIIVAVWKSLEKYQKEIEEIVKLCEKAKPEYGERNNPNA